jgi:hypothetical protein
MSSWTCSRTSLIGGSCRLCFTSSADGIMLKPRGNFAEYLQVSEYRLQMLICSSNTCVITSSLSSSSTVTYLTVFKTLTALMLLVLCHNMVAVCCWFQAFCCLLTTETWHSCGLWKHPIRCLLNNDTDSYCNLLGYDTIWSGGGSQYFGGAYFLHLQDRSQPRWESGWLYMSRSRGGGGHGSC